MNGESPRLFRHHSRDDRLRSRPGERWFADKHLICNAPERVDVAALVGGLIARRRLGPRRLASRGGRRVLVPFSGRLDPIVLDAQIHPDLPGLRMFDDIEKQLTYAIEQEHV